MGTPRRTSILLDLRADLATVTTPTYKTAVVTVDDGIRPIEDVPQAERPYIGWATGMEIPTYQPFGNMRWTLPVVLVGYVHASGWEARSAAINNLLDDLIAVISADPTRGGYAICTWIRGTETNESDPDAGADGFCIVDAEISFDRDGTSS